MAPGGGAFGRFGGGRFVCVEGIEGSGKSTLLAGLVSRLQGAGVSVVATREPGGTPLGDRLRAVFVEPGLRIAPLAEAFVVNASRAQHVDDVIEPALREGVWIVCDRFAGATLAYQGFGRGVDLDVLRSLASAATRGRLPDVTFLIDVSVDLSRARVAARSRARGEEIDRLEREDAAFHERVRDGYLELARVDATFVVLDGGLGPELLCEAAWNVLIERFGI